MAYLPQKTFKDDFDTNKTGKIVFDEKVAFEKIVKRVSTNGGYNK